MAPLGSARHPYAESAPLWPPWALLSCSKTLRLSSRHEPALGTPSPEPLLKGIWFATKKEEEVDCGGGLNTGPGPRLAAQAPPPVLHAIRSRSRRTSVLPQRRTVAIEWSVPWVNVL